MSLRWRISLVLYMICPVQPVDLLHPSFLLVTFGEYVTLNCPVGDNYRRETVTWYKQSAGEMPRKIGERLAYKPVSVSTEFKNDGYMMENTDNGILLMIPEIKKHHEGLYYCVKSFTLEAITLSNGTLLVVTDDGDVKVSVLQRGVFSVPAGASVTLQCSVLSERTTSQLQVLWFRAAPAQSHPQIIYTHHNSSQQCDSGSPTHTCVYNFSKNILSLNDTGTYYCAVLLCGKMLLGNGTRVQLENVATVYDATVICMGTVLVLCGILISVQAVLLCKRKNCHQCKDFGSRHDAVINTEQMNTQDHGPVELNYAALHFDEGKRKRLREIRGQPEDSVYSQVKHSSIH